jgi:LCP family protein required for cell wall assembly
MGSRSESKNEAAQRAAYKAEQVRTASYRPGYGANRGKARSTDPPVPWILRKRVLAPLFLLLGLGVPAAFFWWTAPVTNTLTGETGQRGDAVAGFFNNLVRPELPLSASFNGKTQISVLLVGLDHVPERKGEYVFHRSDSMLFGAVDFTTHQVRLCSVPRDTWAEQKNGRGEVVHDKLGHSYAHGQEQNQDDPESGIRNTSDAVSRLLGLAPEYYVVIQFEGLAKLVDALGGLDVDVEKRMRYRDRAGGLNIKFDKGLQHMTGEEVVQYARFRHDATGDIGRMGRQQKVIKLIIEEIKKPQNFPKAPELLKALHEVVLTNFTIDQLLAFAQKMDEFPNDGMQTMTLQSYGNTEPQVRGMVGGLGGMSVQLVLPEDIEKARQFLQDLQPPPDPKLGPDGVAGTADDLPAEETAMPAPDDAGED